MERKLFIKNMVCPRCILTVESVLNDFGLEIIHIELGEVEVREKPNQTQLKELKEKLYSFGFELLEDHASKVITKIKSILIDSIHYNNNIEKVNYSILLSDNLNQEYSSLSKLFSSVEGITIEKFVVKQKIERVKELIIYNELPLKEIAFGLNYSSVAYLSNQFKKETGMTPSQFKNQNIRNRKPLDSI